MSNIDNPHGFRPVRSMYGEDPFKETLSKVVGYGTAFYKYDVVHRVADGSVETFASATPGTTNISGVNLNYAAASTASDHTVVTDPFVICEAQDNNDTDGIAAADLGLNCNIEANAGSSTTKISGHELDESTANTTNSLDCHLARLFADPNNAHGSWARIEVTFNKHRYLGGVAGV